MCESVLFFNENAYIMKTKNFLSVLLGATTLFLFYACNKKSNNPIIVPPPPPAIAAATVLNYPYGANAAMKMDIYLPAGRSATTTKTIVVIHGGSWIGGDKADLNPFIDSLKRVLPGWAIINVNYPLIDIASGANRYPAQISFIRRAMDTIKNNVEAWGITSKFGMWGISAGANLALMHSYTQNADGLVKAVANLFGPTDLRDCWVNPPGGDTRTIVLNYTGILIPNIFGADAYDWGSPWYMMPNNATPTITFHGTNDVLVSVTQGRKLRDKLNAKGVLNQYHEYAGVGHELWAPDKMTDMFNKLGNFMIANVQ